MSAEASEINTKPNFSKIWKVVDEIEKTKSIEKKSMNKKNLENYLSIAKDILEKESISS